MGIQYTPVVFVGFQKLEAAVVYRFRLFYPLDGYSLRKSVSVYDPEFGIANNVT